MVFGNREEAGRYLGERLSFYKNWSPVVLALARGGIPVGYAISQALNAPLEVLVVRKIGAPGNPEFGVGAIAENNTTVLDYSTIKALGIPQETISKITQKEKKELKRRVDLYRKGLPLPHLEGKTVILVDDGLATGMTAKAAITAIKKMHPKKMIFASPVCAEDSVENLRTLVDEVVCLVIPMDFIAVGAWYRNFSQVTDKNVLDLLAANRGKHLRTRLAVR